MSQHHELNADTVHKTWDNSIEARLTIDAGDTVTFDTRDAADLYYSPDSLSEDIEKRGPFVGHPLTGPVYIRDAAPGDVLAIEVRAMEFASPFGWTAVRKGRGLLPEADVPGPYLQIWDITDGTHARMRQRSDIAVPVDPFASSRGPEYFRSGRCPKLAGLGLFARMRVRRLIRRPGQTLAAPAQQLHHGHQ